MSESQIAPEVSSGQTQRTVKRGKLTVFLGAAPGVGKTYAMLEEGHALKKKGVDVVVGFVQTYGRPKTQAMLEGLEIIPPKKIEYKGLILEEMDVDAIKVRRPQVVLVDELAHTNVPGSKHEKRWQDVEELLDEGFDVLTTVNIQHLESMKDVVEQVTGITVQETVPDVVVDRADAVELIDMTPQALRKRMRHGNIYPLDKVEWALNNFFREGNLTALRELALWYVVNHRSRKRRQDKRETVMIAVSCRESSTGLIRRGIRMARRLGAKAIVMTVRPDESEAKSVVEPYARLAETLGAKLVIRYGLDVAQEIINAARELNATHVIIAGRRQKPGFSFKRTGIERIVVELQDRNVHVIGRRLGVPTTQVSVEELRKDPERWLKIAAPRSNRGDLRLYLGYAPCSGKTTKMLEEAIRRRTRGTDVVVGAVDAKGRPGVQILLEQLPYVPPLANGLLDIAKLIERNASVICVDDIAVCDPESGKARYMQIPELLNAGMHVIGTLNIYDLSSCKHALKKLKSDSVPRALIDDSFLDLADELELVDVAPNILYDRLEATQSIEPNLKEMLSESVLEELRELALKKVASHTEKHLMRYMEEHRISDIWPTQERIAVAVAPDRVEMASYLLKAGIAMAKRQGAEIALVTVLKPNDRIKYYQGIRQIEELAKREGVFLYELEEEGDVANTLIKWAYQHHVTSIVLFPPRAHPRLPWKKSIVFELMWQAHDIDIHLLGSPHPH
jgi:two-component system sensor histidine kinase KdpD